MLDDIVEILERVRDTARVTGNLAEAQRVEGLIDYVSGRIEGDGSIILDATDHIGSETYMSIFGPRMVKIISKKFKIDISSLNT